MGTAHLEEQKCDTFAIFISIFEQATISGLVETMDVLYSGLSVTALV